jgi:hypothetical protein
MIDTIVLVLSEGKYTILEPDKFTPSARWILDDESRFGGRGYIVSKQNPTPTELRNGIYRPRLTLTNRYNHLSKHCEASLRIELSLSKLLFGNNFDELQNDEFTVVIDLLEKSLKEMGVLVWSYALVSAPVSAIHYSKNIVLTDGTTPHYYIGKIKEANINLSVDVNQTDFRNDGTSFKWHCNSYEVAFYDKRKDLEKAKVSGKRAIEKDNAIQLSLFDQLDTKKPFEVLRIEVRLNKRAKIKQLMKKIGKPNNLTLRDLFDSKKSQAILLHFLDEMEKKRPFYARYQSASDKDFLADLVIHNPNLSISRIMQLFGLKQALDKVTTRELRLMFGRCHARSWYRLMGEARRIVLPKSKDTFDLIREDLIAFVPLKLDSSLNKMLNKDN